MPVVSISIAHLFRRLRFDPVELDRLAARIAAIRLTGGINLIPDSVKCPFTREEFLGWSSELLTRRMSEERVPLDEGVALLMINMTKLPEYINVIEFDVDLDRYATNVQDAYYCALVAFMMQLAIRGKGEKAKIVAIPKDSDNFEVKTFRMMSKDSDTFRPNFKEGRLTVTSLPDAAYAPLLISFPFPEEMKARLLMSTAGAKGVNLMLKPEIQAFFDTDPDLIAFNNIFKPGKIFYLANPLFPDGKRNSHIMNVIAGTFLMRKVGSPVEPQVVDALVHNVTQNFSIDLASGAMSLKQFVIACFGTTNDLPNLLAAVQAHARLNPNFPDIVDYEAHTKLVPPDYAVPAGERRIKKVRRNNR